MPYCAQNKKTANYVKPGFTCLFTFRCRALAEKKFDPALIVAIMAW